MKIPFGRRLADLLRPKPEPPPKPVYDTALEAMHSKAEAPEDA